MSSNLVNAVSGKWNDAITSGVTFENLSSCASVCEVWTTQCGCRIIITSNLFLSRNTNSIRRCHARSAVPRHMPRTELENQLEAL